jgi:CHAT domain-containing protein
MRRELESAKGVVLGPYRALVETEFVLGALLSCVEIIRPACILFTKMRKVALALVILGALAIGLCWPFERAPSVEWLLQTTVLDPRPVAGRLSWEQLYAPYPEASCSAPSSFFDSRSQLCRALVRIAIRAERRGSARNRHTLGISHLLCGNVGSATAVLRRAAALAPHDVEILNDFAVAQLSMAQGEGHPDALLDALEAADQALTIGPGAPAARFNRALILQELGLSSLAQSAWRDYLGIDSSSLWAQEARRHLVSITNLTARETWEKAHGRLDAAVEAGDAITISHIVEQFPTEARIHIEDELLGVWAEAHRAGANSEADRRLRAARRLAEALLEGGEHLPMDAIAVIEKAANRSDVLAHLAEGYLSYRRGRKLYTEARYQEAWPEFERAQQALAHAGSPAALLAELHLAILQYQRYEFQQVHQALDQILEGPGIGSYPGLRGRVLWTRALAELASGQPAASFATYQEALASFETGGYKEEVGAVQALLAENLRYLGERDRVWDHLRRACTAARASGDARRLQVALTESANAAIEAGRPAMAHYFRDEAVRIATQAGEPTALAYALLLRSRTSRQVADENGAAEDLAKAGSLLALIPDPRQQERLQADLLIDASTGPELKNPALAVDQLSKALHFYAGSGARFPLGRIYLARARAYIALGDRDAAETDFASGIEEYERQRRRIPEEHFQISFFDRSRALFEAMMQLELDRGRSASAFDYAERQRARALLDHLGDLLNHQQRERLLASVEMPRTSQEICRNMPPRVAVVEYALLEDRLLSWVLRRDRLKVSQQRIRRSEVERSVALLREALLRPAVGGRGPAASALLYDLLLRPLQPYLEPGDTVVLVADGALHAVPFAALFDVHSRHYFVQDHALVYAPSASFYLRAIARDHRQGPLGAATALAVGNPVAPDRTERNLPDLPYAEREARALAAQFPGSELLVGRQATRKAVLAGAARHPLLHFAGHALVNREFPFLSYLLLAPGSTADSGELYAHEIHYLRLEQTRLVVLAACSSARGEHTGEGVLSLARAFLAAGVPTVVASLWDVGDRDSVPLFDSFYLRLRQGRSPADALRDAQLALLADASRQGAEQDFTWAAFEVVGSGMFNS